MRVLYNDGGFIESHGGVSRYYTEILKHFPKDVSWTLALSSTSNYYLQKPPFSIPPHRQSVQDFIHETLHNRSFPGVSHLYKMLARVFPSSFPSGELANDRLFKRLVREGNFDLLHITDPHPHFNVWSDVVGRKPIVATVVDLIPELFGGSSRIRRMRQRLFHDASHVIAISENTKKDLVRLYGVPESKVSVIYLGHQEGNNADEIPELKGLKYILFVGKREGYKNAELFFRALAPLLRENRSLHIVCTGHPFAFHEHELLMREGISDQVLQLFIPDGAMGNAFSHAVCFVYPSRYEGFGIPILDAFSAGCPVVLSRSSCFPEIAGEAALFFDPDDKEDLQAAVASLCSDISLRNRLVAFGHERVKQFSWERCANETSSIYRQVISEFGR